MAHVFYVNSSIYISRSSQKGRMEPFLTLLPDVLRSLSTALIVRSSVANCPEVTCAPTLYCANPGAETLAATASAVVNCTLGSRVWDSVIGFVVGISAACCFYYCNLRKRRSAAQIALSANRKDGRY